MSRSVSGACSEQERCDQRLHGALEVVLLQARARTRRGACWISRGVGGRSSLSMKKKTRSRTSEQSLSWGLPQLMTRPPSAAGAGGQAALAGVVREHLAQLAPAAVQPRHHGADRRAHDLGDLLVGEALDVGEVDREPEVLGELLEGVLDVGVGQVLERLGLGGLQPGRGVRLGAGELPVLDVLGHRLLRLALLLAVGVDEGVGQDPVEPGLEVRARLELVEGARTPWRRSPGPGPRRRPGCGSSASRPSRAGRGTASRRARSAAAARPRSRSATSTSAGSARGRGAGFSVIASQPTGRVGYDDRRAPRASVEHGRTSLLATSRSLRESIVVPWVVTGATRHRRIDSRRPTTSRTTHSSTASTMIASASSAVTGPRWAP